MEKFYLTRFRNMLLIVLAMASFSVSAQCPEITCPPNITVTQDSSACGAIVNYTPPVGVDLCASQIFNYTGSIQFYTVPAGVTSLYIVAKGAEGGNHASSVYTGGLGASMSGTFSVTSGQQLKILVGGSPGTTGNGGGGGTFVTDMMDNPLIVAGGGGGSSDGHDNTAKHGQDTTVGGNGGCGGGTGGSAGNGGLIGATFASGAGGGLLTDGQAGWVSTSGGKAFVNGGAGGTGGAVGGFGGGGSGSLYVVGGGGGGYSGGGPGSNSCGGGSAGGGGGSFNAGTNQVNIAGVNTGHGSVEITTGGPPSTSLLSGPASGSFFPLGTTPVSYIVVDQNGMNPDTCTFTITVTPLEVQDTANICTGDSIILGGDWQKSPGIYTDTLTSSLGCDSVVHTSLFLIPPPPVHIANFQVNNICITHPAVPLPAGSPGGGIFTGPGLVSGTFDPAAAGPGTHWIFYSIIGANGCPAVDSTSITVEPCTGIPSTTAGLDIVVYPNPSDGQFIIEHPELPAGSALTVKNLIGQEVLKIENLSDSKTEINLKGFDAGNYLLQLNTPLGNLNRLITVQ